MSLQKAVEEHISTARRADEELIDPDDFVRNPIIYYRRMLEKTKKSDHFNDSQDFIAIILRQKEVTSPLTEALGGTGYNILPSNSPTQATFYNIIIPDIDINSPIPESIRDLRTISTFYDAPARIGYYFGNQPLQAGYIVRVKQPLLCGKNNKMPEIDLVYSKFVIEEKILEKASNALQKCLQEIKVDTPPIVIKPQKPETLNLISKEDSDRIYSSFKFNRQAAIANSPVSGTANPSSGTPNSNTPSQPTESEKKNDKVSKTAIKPTNVEVCSDKPPPVLPTQITPPPVQDKGDKNNFVKNNKNTEAKTKISLPENTQFFSSMSDDPKSLILKGSEDPNSNNPVIIRPEDDREITMIMVKNVSYISASAYYQTIKSDKVPAAHFCIDNDGTIYQFTDTKNYIRNYNPSVDELTVSVALINISFRNSNSTLINKSNGDLNSLYISTFDDKQKLRNYLKRKTGEDRGSFLQEVSSSIANSLGFTKDRKYIYDTQDNREIFPYYRLDATEKQKKSLKSLIVALRQAYDIPDLITNFKGYNPEVLNGEFSGIIAPYNVSLTESEPYNLPELLDWYYDKKAKTWLK
jgi:hypothetical protein